MKVLITHLTRMAYPRVCVAGLDEAGHYVRPIVVKGEVLDLEAVRNGLLRLGNRIDLGWHRFRDPPQPPEVEDCYFSLSKARLVNRVSPEEFWSDLKRSAKGSLDAIFGEQLRPRKTSLGYTLVLPTGQGKASLGDLQVEEFDLLLQEYEGELKLRGVFVFDRSKQILSLPVTDLRFYDQGKDGFQLNMEKVEKVRGKLGRTQIILSLGFSRPFGPESWHWLQINGVHLESDPLWE